MRTRSYSELRRLTTLEERFEYLRLKGQVGEATFGSERYLNQRFYTSAEWRHVRHLVIARDQACDLGIEGFEVHQRISIHHMNPISIDDFARGNEDILNPEFLISVSHRTHNAIHYGDSSLLPPRLIERQAGDTTLWSRKGGLSA